MARGNREGYETPQDTVTEPLPSASIEPPVGPVPFELVSLENDGRLILDEELRIAALRAAADSHKGHDVQRILKVAEEYYNWLKKAQDD